MRIALCALLLLTLAGCSRVFDVLIANHTSERVELLITYNNRSELERVQKDGLKMLRGIPALDDMELEDFKENAQIRAVDSSTIEIDLYPNTSLHVGTYINKASQIRRLRIGDCELSAAFDCTLIDKRMPMLGWNAVIMRYGLGPASVNNSHN